MSQTADKELAASFEQLLAEAMEQPGVGDVMRIYRRTAEIDAALSPYARLSQSQYSVRFSCVSGTLVDPSER